MSKRLIMQDRPVRPSRHTVLLPAGVRGVVFAGFRHDLDRVLPAFSAFCLSSHLEGLGTSLLDAMSFGLPVVATGAGGIPEAVEHRQRQTTRRGCTLSIPTHSGSPREGTSPPP